jgi:hypothetical protein
MTKKKNTNKNQAKATKVMEVSTEVGKRLADTLKAPARQASAAKDTGLGPNAKFPFGIKIVVNGNTSWERFKTAKERDQRNATVKGEVVNHSAPAAPAKDPNAISIHINRTGRVCFGKDAAQRLGNFFPDGYMTLAIEDGTVRLTPTNKKVEGAVDIRNASGRPYISATKQFKPLGFDGSRAMDIEAKPFGDAGFEFRLA